MIHILTRRRRRRRRMRMLRISVCTSIPLFQGRESEQWFRDWEVWISFHCGVHLTLSHLLRPGPPNSPSPLPLSLILRFCLSVCCCCCCCLNNFSFSVSVGVSLFLYLKHRLVGLVVKASASRAADHGSNPSFRLESFFRLSHTQ